MQRSQVAVGQEKLGVLLCRKAEVVVVWTPLFLDPSDGVFGRFDLAALAVVAPFCLFVHSALDMH